MDLSNLQFLNGLQCLKMLWLEKYMPEMLSAPNVEEKRILYQDMEVRMAARNLFVGGKEVTADPRAHRYFTRKS
ncbi:hypothetical protein [Helicobacter suis]|uniref:hypothetical protein n=1 Tax=Helicobacter suis TaxID=104628 RepID=UPI0013D13CE9|nr:hypothetical protein [Helicobacter suis]